MILFLILITIKILARLSSYATTTSSSEQCSKITALLVQSLAKNRKESEENEINILSALNQLVRRISIESINDLCLPLSRLFGVVTNRASRVELVGVFEAIGSETSDEFYVNCAKLVGDLNSWDVRRLEEPDYMRRLDAFSKLNAIINEWTRFDLRLGALLTYNCVFFLNHVRFFYSYQSWLNV